MLKISKLTDYAVVLLGAMRDGGRYAASSLAQKTLIPEPTVAKILKILAGTGILISHRGMNGGYELVKPLDDISILDIVVAIDGPVAVTSCVDGANHVCSAEHICNLRGRWDYLNNEIKEVLYQCKVATLLEQPRQVAFADKKREQAR